MLFKEVGFFDTDGKQAGTYQEIKQSSHEIVETHQQESENFGVKLMKNKISFLFCIGFQKCIKILLNKDLLRLHIVVLQKIFLP